MKRILLLLLLQMSVIAGFAEEYKDPATNVIYTYYPASNRAEVKEGFEYDESYMGYEYGMGGSPDAKGEIIILDKITINGKEYIVDKIGVYAFVSMRNIKSVVIPSSVKSIEFGAFLQCTSLSKVVLSHGLDSIGALTFNNCPNLKQISLPEGLKHIGGGALSFCGMSDITIPSSVESIGNMQAFYSPSLKTITSLIKDPFEVNEYFNSELRNVTLRVPVGTKSKYEATTGWRIFKNIEELPYTEEPVTYTQGQMATIILPTTPDASKGKYYRLDRCEDGQIIFEQELQPQAHIPYIIVPSEDFSIDPSTLDLEGLSQDVASIEGIRFVGTYISEVLPSLGGDGGGSYYYDIIDTTPDCQGSASCTGAFVIGTLRAYLEVDWAKLGWDDPIDHGGAKEPWEKMPIILKDNPDGIDPPTPFRGSNGNCYDLSGRRRINLPLKGAGGAHIYIEDGKKRVR